MELVVVHATGDLEHDLATWIRLSVDAMKPASQIELFRALLAAASTDDRVRVEMSRRLLGPLRSTIARAEAAAGRASGGAIADALIGALISAIVTGDDSALERLRRLVSMLAAASHS